LTTTGDLYACELQTNFDTIINRQQRPAKDMTHGKGRFSGSDSLGFAIVRRMCAFWRMLVEPTHSAVGASESVGRRAVHAAVMGWRGPIETCASHDQLVSC
jgi:hypothetical protein